MTKKHLFSRLLKKANNHSSLILNHLPGKPSRPIRSLPTYQVGPRNLRNPWLINDLRAYKSLYNCKETFTDVMSALQIKLFMQNEPKFRKVKLNVNKVLTTDYEQLDTWSSGKKQSQTNPNKAKFKKAKMYVTNYITMDYENKSNWAICENEPNSNPTCRGVASGEVGNEPNFRANIMLLICTTLKVVENSIMTSYHLEPTRPINHRRLQ